MTAPRQLPMFYRETTVRDVNGKNKTPRQRRASMIRQLSNKVHLHEVWQGRTYRWYVVNADYKTQICGTPSCIKVDR